MSLPSMFRVQLPNGQYVETIGKKFRLPNGAEWLIILDPWPPRLLDPQSIAQVQLNMGNMFRNIPPDA